MINRNNYEEYFLMLADNELSPEEEAMVKQFAAKHPDLQEELEILMSCRLDANDIVPVFPKEKLLRTTTWNAGQPEPVQTQMLLMLDNELALAEQQQLQATIAASTALQTEWNTLQQTKLIAEAIAHPDKESLYRKNRKIRPLVWVRWAAAAAVLFGFGWFAWMNNSNTTNTSTPTLANNTPAQKVSPINSATPTQPPGVSTQPSVMPEKSAINTLAAVNTKEKKLDNLTASATEPRKQAQQQKETPSEILTVQKPEDVYYAQIKPTEDQPILANINSADMTVSPTNPDNKVAQLSHINADPTQLPTVGNKQKNEVFTGSKTMLTDDEEEYITIGGARIQKQKMRGLFRNVTRSVARSLSKSKMEPDVYVTR